MPLQFTKDNLCDFLKIQPLQPNVDYLIFYVPKHINVEHLSQAMEFVNADKEEGNRYVSVLIGTNDIDAVKVIKLGDK